MRISDWSSDVCSSDLAEAEATVRLLALIATQTEFANALAADEEQTIGVICMYKKQKQEIERRFAQQPFDAPFRRTVKIDTVDSYQGKEKDRKSTRLNSSH